MSEPNIIALVATLSFVTVIMVGSPWLMKKIYGDKKTNQEECKE